MRILQILSLCFALVFFICAALGIPSGKYNFTAAGLAFITVFLMFLHLG